MSETDKSKGWYQKDGKKQPTKNIHSETYDNETYKYIKEGRHAHWGGGAGKGDADRTRKRGSFRENYEDIDWNKK